MNKAPQYKDVKTMAHFKEVSASSSSIISTGGTTVQNQASSVDPTSVTLEKNGTNSLDSTHMISSMQETATSTLSAAVSLSSTGATTLNNEMYSSERPITRATMQKNASSKSSATDSTTITVDKTTEKSFLSVGVTTLNNEMPSAERQITQDTLLKNASNTLATDSATITAYKTTEKNELTVKSTERRPYTGVPTATASSTASDASSSCIYDDENVTGNYLPVSNEFACGKSMTVEIVFLFSSLVLIKTESEIDLFRIVMVFFSFISYLQICFHIIPLRQNALRCTVGLLEMIADFTKLDGGLEVSCMCCIVVLDILSRQQINNCDKDTLNILWL